MSWLWMIFTFLNFWWICAFIVIAFQGQRTNQLKKTILYTSLMSAGVTGVVAVLMDYGIISFV